LVLIPGTSNGDFVLSLHEKVYLSNPIGKAKSVAMDEKGYKKAEALFKKYFVNDYE
jgi:hypothetical protein